MPIIILQAKCQFQMLHVFRSTDLLQTSSCDCMRTFTWTKVREVFAAATLAGDGIDERRPETPTSETAAREPIRLPLNETAQLRSSCCTVALRSSTCFQTIFRRPGNVTLPHQQHRPLLASSAAQTTAVQEQQHAALWARTASGSSIVLPVNSSAPVVSTSSKPMGRPKAPRMSRWSPGLADARPGHDAPTASTIMPPKLIKAPAIKLSRTALSRGLAALAAPKATSCTAHRRNAVVTCRRQSLIRLSTSAGQGHWDDSRPWNLFKHHITSAAVQDA